MDALNDPRWDTVVVMTSSQIGKTEIENNIIGYFIENDPCPMLMVWPTLEMGEAWSKDRFAPMVRDTPSLQSMLGDPRSREKGSTIRHKTFAGGHLTVAGANSAASLAGRPVRLVCCDEVDRFPPSAGPEGDPVSLARKRTTTFWNRKLFMCSTPTIKGSSRIEAAYDYSTRDQYWVPCHKCGEHQVLRWGQVRWDDDSPETARYECEHCDAQWSDAQRWDAIRPGRGEWRSREPDAPVRGFHLNEIYSPWVRLAEMVATFMASKDSPETLKTFVNTALAETWEERGEQDFDLVHLAEERPEHWGVLPAAAIVVVAGADVQMDRLEVEVVAWAEDGESWSVAYEVIDGDPRIPVSSEFSPWKRLDELLATDWAHESGHHLTVSACAVDGNYLADEVYAYTKPREHRGVVAVRGASGEGAPVIKARTRNNSAKALIYTLGVDTLKSRMYSRMAIEEPGPGYCHFPMDRGFDYFEQLLSERAVKRYRRGYPIVEWVKRKGQQRNEPLDCRNYATAALQIRKPNWSAIRRRIGAPAVERSIAPMEQRPPRRRRQISKGIG